MTVESIINDLHYFSPRLLQNQINAATYIKKILNENNLPFTVEEFETETPIFTKCELSADGQPIKCMPASLVSGTIDNNLNVFDVSEDEPKPGLPMLYFNGKSNAISRANHYQDAPALAFSRLDLAKVQKAKAVHGEINVERQSHTSQNILLGNFKTPTNLIFTHFDSLEGGAMDNASGVAITLMAILEHPEILQNNLFIVSSDEEISFDRPWYWGKGYRDFEKKHADLLESCQKIYIVDSFGLSPSIVHQHVIDEYFPIVNDKILPKTFAVSCTEESQWSVYHSADDTPEKLNPQYLADSLQQVIQLLSANVPNQP